MHLHVEDNDAELKRPNRKNSRALQGKIRVLCIGHDLSGSKANRVPIHRR